MLPKTYNTPLLKMAMWQIFFSQGVFFSEAKIYRVTFFLYLERFSHMQIRNLDSISMRTQLEIPMRHGGCGLRISTRSAPTGWAAAWQDVQCFPQALNSAFFQVLFDRSSLDSQYVAARLP